MLKQKYQTHRQKGKSIKTKKIKHYQLTKQMLKKLQSFLIEVFSVENGGVYLIF